MPSLRRFVLGALAVSVGCFSPEEDDGGSGSDTDVGTESSTMSTTVATLSTSESATDTTTASTTASTTATTDASDSDTDTDTDPTDPDTSTGDPLPACGDGEATPGEFCPVLEPESLPPDASTSEVVVADLDGDERLDVAALTDLTVVHLWRNDGTGALSEPTPLAVSDGSCGLAAADGEGDGDVDLVALGESLVSLVNDGSGGFVRNDSDPDGFGGCSDHNDLGILNNNGGVLDAVTSGAYNNSYSPGVNPPAGWSFGMPSGIGGVTEGASGVTVTEWAFDDDNTDDVIVLNQYYTTAELFAGNGMGGFTALGEIDACLGLNGAAGARYAATGDIDGDGSVDLVITCMAGNFVVVLGTDTAAFQAPVETLLAGAHQPFVTDLDDDDDLDVLVSTTSGQAVNVYLNDGGALADPIELAVPGDARGIAVGDLEDDGAPEILVALRSETGGGVAIIRMDP